MVLDQISTSFSGSGSLPDNNTSEAILYGKAYSWIKSAMWAWDEMMEYLENKANSLESQIIDREWSYKVMRYNPYLIMARSPPVNEVDHLKDLFTLKSLVKVLSGMRKIEQYRRQNLAWARQQGIEQYVGSLSGRGITEAQWKAATASFNMQPINYQSVVNGMSPADMPEEDFDWDEAMRDLMGEDEYERVFNKALGIGPEDDEHDRPVSIFDSFVKEIGEDIDVSTGEVRDTREDEFEEDEQESTVDNTFWQGLDEAFALMFDDPMKEAINSVTTVDDECSQAAEFLDLMDSDDEQIVDELIDALKEVPA